MVAGRSVNDTPCTSGARTVTVHLSLRQCASRRCADSFSSRSSMGIPYDVCSCTGIKRGKSGEGYACIGVALVVLDWCTPPLPTDAEPFALLPYTRNTETLQVSAWYIHFIHLGHTLKYFQGKRRTGLCCMCTCKRATAFARQTVQNRRSKCILQFVMRCREQIALSTSESIVRRCVAIPCRFFCVQRSYVQQANRTFALPVQRHPNRSIHAIPVHFIATLFL